LDLWKPKIEESGHHRGSHGNRPWEKKKKYSTSMLMESKGECDYEAEGWEGMMFHTHRNGS
jgi:hypothetical protein